MIKTSCASYLPFLFPHWTYLLLLLFVRLSICTANHRFPCYCVREVIMRILSHSRGMGRARDRIVKSVTRTVHPLTVPLFSFLFCIHVVFSLNRAKRWNFTEPERMIRSSLFIFRFSRRFPSFLFSDIARDFSIQPFIAPDVESVREFVV